MAVLHRQPKKLKAILMLLSLFHASAMSSWYPNGTKRKEEKTLILNSWFSKDKYKTKIITKSYIATAARVRQMNAEDKRAVLSDGKQDVVKQDLTSSKHLRKFITRHRRQLTSFTPENDNITCADTFSCKGKCKIQRDPATVFKPCFCDKYCNVFQDCCADYTQACPKNTTINSSHTTDAQWHCIQGDGLNDSIGVWMISSCPGNWTKNNITSKCIEPVSTAPVNYMYKDIVPVIDEKGNTYKNRFCALCHGIEPNETQLYDVLQGCEDNFGFWKFPVPIVFNISEAMLRNCSYVTWKIPQGAPRRYCVEIKNNGSCSLQSPVLEKLCSSSISGAVSDEEHFYWNKCCALCNNISIDSIMCVPDFNQSEGKNTNFAVVASGVQETTSKTQSCSNGNVYDPFLSKCRPTIAASSISPLFTKNSIYIRFRSRSNHDPKEVYAKNLKKILEKKLQIGTFPLRVIEVSYTGCLVYTAYLLLWISPDTADVHFTINTLFNLNLKVGNISFVAFEGSTRLFPCFRVDSYKPGEYTVVEFLFPFTVFINRTGESFDATEYYMYTKQNSSHLPVGDIFVCRNRIGFNCSGVFIALEEHEYVILPSNTLYRNQSKLVHEFEMANGTAIICVNYSANYVTKEDPAENLALVVLTYVGLLLSIPCLLFVLVTYSLFKELRTLPGMNLMNLSLSLLLTHSLFLGAGATHVQLICTVIAALLHYFFLVSFVWMSIIAFDTYRAFSRTCPSLQRAKKWKRRFIAMGWLPAFVFVAICVSLDQSEVVDIGYGGSKSCWINNGRSNVYFFVVPVVFSVVFNAFFFILTVHSIRKTKKQTERVAAVSNRQSNFKLFLKLAILMGFTWIFGYLRLLVSDYFDYPFVIFNSLQGVYIAVAFVFTSRVKKMYCQLFGGTEGTKTISASVVTLESRL